MHNINILFVINSAHIGNKKSCSIYRFANILIDSKDGYKTILYGYMIWIFWKYYSSKFNKFKHIFYFFIMPLIKSKNQIQLKGEGRRSPKNTPMDIYVYWPTGHRMMYWSYRIPICGLNTFYNRCNHEHITYNDYNVSTLF